MKNILVFSFLAINIFSVTGAQAQDCGVDHVNVDQALLARDSGESKQKAIENIKKYNFRGKTTYMDGMYDIEALVDFVYGQKNRSEAANNTIGVTVRNKCEREKNKN